jgi:hypothetical protein
MHPFYRIVVFFAASLLFAPAAYAEFPLTPHCKIRFATRDEGAAAITARDFFTEHLSRFDLQARLRTDRPVTLDDWRKFVTGEVRDWTDDERTRAAAALSALRDRFASLELPLPDEIYLVVTSGQEESEAAYCRGRYIVLPRSVLRRERAELQALLAHEIFHVISNQNPQLRPKLYAIVGFEHCVDIPIHPSLQDRRITNPDAPSIDCVIEIREGERAVHAAPVLYASEPMFNPKRAGGFFGHMTFRLMVVEREGDQWKPVDRDGKAVVLDPTRVPDFFTKVGRNTSYIVHPEEILADNFMHLAMGKRDLPTPRIVDDLQRVLAGD